MGTGDEAKEPAEMSERGFIAGIIIGAVLGAFSAATVGGIGLIFVLMMRALILSPETKEISETFLILLMCSPIFSFPAGAIMGIFIGVIDPLTHRWLSDPSTPLWVWVPIGIVLGAVGGSIAYVAWAGFNYWSDPMFFKEGAVFGAIGGLFAGPFFGLMFRRRIKQQTV